MRCAIGAADETNQCVLASKSEEKGGERVGKRLGSKAM